MILLQLSAGQGPEECAKAVALAVKRMQKEAKAIQVDIAVMECAESGTAGCYKSVLVKLEGDQAESLAQRWTGIMQWTCTSPLRPKHKRKNWFFSGKRFDLPDATQNAGLEQDIRFKTCRASGAGGQHVNTTDSAVQATHIPSGISVRVESERSQHANKRLARLLIGHKLDTLKAKKNALQDKQRWTQHWQLERGNAQRTFSGLSFEPEG